MCRAYCELLTAHLGHVTQSLKLLYPVCLDLLKLERVLGLASLHAIARARRQCVPLFPAANTDSTGQDFDQWQLNEPCPNVPEHEDALYYVLQSTIQYVDALNGPKHGDEMQGR